MNTEQRNCVQQLQHIDVEDLQYIEKDLNYSDLVSLGFLLFAEDRANAEYLLQKLLVLAQTSTHNSAGDLLRKYAVWNTHNWRAYLVEALAIIGQRRVLRKLGFNWEELHQHYLPHIAELSVHVHPLLKALYIMCEQLTPAQAGHLVLEINEQFNQTNEILRFYNYEHLEVFLLDWITRRIISLGDQHTNNADLNVLLSYFKMHDLDMIKQLLESTMNSNKEEGKMQQLETVLTDDTSNSSSCVKQETLIPATNQTISESERYLIRYEYAGIVLIINQNEFYEDKNPNLKHLLPIQKLPIREGTNVDKKRLKSVFSSFGYKPMEFDNISHLDMLHYIREAVKRSVLFDSLIVCILSHGIDGAVYGCNSVPVSISDIEQIISTSTLQGKPKMLIIQACQKDDVTKNQILKKLCKIKISNCATTHNNSNDSSLSNITNNVRADAFADVIKAMSTVPGFVSMRHTETGTWFIQSLCSAIDKYGDSKHMLDILVSVTREVSMMRGHQNEVMLPLTVNTLTKFFFLSRRN